MEITVNELMVRVVVNDQVVVDTDIRNIVPDGYDYAGLLNNKSGNIEIQPIGNGRTEFRNIRIKELP